MQGENKAGRELRLGSLVAVPDTGCQKRTKRDAPGKIIGTLLSRRLPGGLGDILKDISFLLLSGNRVVTH